MKYSQCIYASFEILPLPHEVSCIPGRLKLPYVTDDLGALILPPPPDCWDYRTVPPSLIQDDPGPKASTFPTEQHPQVLKGRFVVFIVQDITISPILQRYWEELMSGKCLMKLGIWSKS